MHYENNMHITESTHADNLERDGIRYLIDFSENTVKKSIFDEVY